MAKKWILGYRGPRRRFLAEFYGQLLSNTENTWWHDHSYVNRQIELNKLASGNSFGPEIETLLQKTGWLNGLMLFDKSLYTKCFISLILSTSIYDLVLIYVCHFHHHHYRNGCSTLSTIEILVRLSWIPASKEFWNLKYC